MGGMDPQVDHLYIMCSEKKCFRKGFTCVSLLKHTSGAS
uniref:Uncharacterized protein n=1 Tax=Anguilla anguilla TaxID=7936 RepID=A0A0E9RF52_ANGAN